ncbi:MAG: prolipoprotein diacylglyceryl transferase [Caulobacterales bacterium 32-67-6]|nr:MAG: prolipoprotein diacylglyceryl transferase [Caulobacterales bacterium 32-67-6]
MPFPEFDPILIQIGPFAIRWYALAYVAGILIGWRYVVMLVRNPQLAPVRGPAASPAQIDDLILWVTLGIILGGRLGYILFYAPATIWTDPLQVFQVWQGGMSFHGGALGVAIAVAAFARSNGIDLLRLGDLVAACVPIGLFFGRIANFINGELWGRPTELPWGVIFPGAGPYPRHPSQLYEALLEGIVLFIILRIATHRAHWLERRGAVAGLFLVGYAAFRTLVEQVREPDAFLPDFPLGLTMGMMLSLPMLLGGAFLIWRGLREPVPAAEAPAAAQPAAPAAAEAAEDPFRIQPAPGSDGPA